MKRNYLLLGLNIFTLIFFSINYLGIHFLGFSSSFGFGFFGESFIEFLPFIDIINFYLYFAFYLIILIAIFLVRKLTILKKGNLFFINSSLFIANMTGFVFMLFLYGLSFLIMGAFNG